MRDLLFRNVGLKLLSLLFAISLWLFVNLKATADRELQLPVRWENLPNFLEITNPVNDSIRVRVTGPRRILTHLNPNRYPVILDLSDATVGLRDYQISDKMISLVPGLKATVLPPDTIQFKFDVVVTKEVPVKPQLQGRPPEGFRLTDVKVLPERIEIHGAQSEVLGIHQVETSALDLSELTRSGETKAKILLNRPHVWPSSGQDSVTVRLTIEETVVRKRFPNVPVAIRKNGERAQGRAEPSQVDVILEGAAGLIGSVTPEQMDAYVTLQNKQTGTALLPVTVDTGTEEIRWACEPAQVRVTVSVGGSSD